MQALIRLHGCTDWSWATMVTNATWVIFSLTGPNDSTIFATSIDTDQLAHIYIQPGKDLTCSFQGRLWLKLDTTNLSFILSYTCIQFYHIPVCSTLQEYFQLFHSFNATWFISTKFVKCNAGIPFLFSFHLSTKCSIGFMSSNTVYL